MYADRVETAPKSSIRDRLSGGLPESSGRLRQVTGKRQRRDDDKWVHDLYENAGPQVSIHRVGAHDLRLKLQKKSTQQSTQGADGSLSRGVRDLHEKLSGITYSHLQETAPAKPKPILESSKPARRGVAAGAPVKDTKKVASAVNKKRTQKKAETVDSFLQALGLEKYAITFQAEEVDMAALSHITDEDLKAIGIPMGPRKKILLALEYKA